LSSEAVPCGEVSRTPDEVSSEAESAMAAPWQNKKLGVPWEAPARPCSICVRCGKLAICQPRPLWYAILLLFSVVFLARSSEATRWGSMATCHWLIYTSCWGGETNVREREMIRPNHYFSINGYWQW
jgi:hypothetical protein